MQPTRPIPIALLLFLLGGCASLPEGYRKSASSAFTDYQSTMLGQAFAAAERDHPGQSGFILMQDNRFAFATRIMLTELAQRSLDVQYYIWESDTTGRILAQRLVNAADRGVKVRVLIDDNNNAGRDSVLATLDTHPNIQVRVFNPFANRNSHLWEFVVDLKRVNHRMHNKLMVADNALAVVGGRNIGDHYFGVNTVANFRDLDVAAVGPVVREVSHTFDYFWNGDWAFPVQAFSKHRYTDTDLRALMAHIDRLIDERAYPFPLDEDVTAIKSRFSLIREQFIWADSGVVWDDPGNIGRRGAADDIAEALRRRLQTLERELLLESAYFVPGERGLAMARELRQRGVRVRILTNSLASNDVLPAHAGYARYRKPLLEAGVELHELRPDSARLRKNWVGQSRASLHTKAMVFDRESAFVGSFNLDPRSAELNTEMGIYIRSPEFAESVAAYLDTAVEPENSYRVLLEDGELVWLARNDGEWIRYAREPYANGWNRFLTGILQLLPIEKQL